MLKHKTSPFNTRWAEFQYDRLAPMAADLVRQRVNAIASLGGTPSALVAKAATSTIPIVFYIGIDRSSLGSLPALVTLAET